MILVYTHPSIVLVTQARAVLEANGIDSVIRNEYAAGAIGELAPIDAWPELWLTDDRRRDEAAALIEAAQREVSGPDWQCGRCGETNPPSFEHCWKCGATM